ncbi:MAG TPA: hypothetical protein VGK74_02420 [Symbiobacteriaceae bacterium]|jgi:hypothetical protein
MQACPKPEPRERRESSGFRQKGKATGKPKEISPLKLATVPEILRHQQRQKEKPKKRRQRKPLRRYTRLQAVKILGRNVIGYAKGGLTYVRGRVNRNTTLKREGRRARRLKLADRRCEAAVHILPCVCGCNAHQRPGVDGVPGKGLISRAHLIPRGAESTRNEDWNNLPACADFHEWLDHTDPGADAKADLLRLTREKGAKANPPQDGIRLDPAEVRPVMDTYCYGTWLADRRAQER